ncbi:DUF305 domain-containing protein [Kineococcus indalonis]|uniref:DUF305 domain-containing protein n=1 Tax=Kineococcus indalonis TaxID=2696566 RepID=UPI00141346F2|nr:DUF305 domain-containing protein [Kineococcus indalonis]NAZ85904.1 DUF305 domain-containing protein [Kineococcus indalonis]
MHRSRYRLPLTGLVLCAALAPAACGAQERAAAPPAASATSSAPPAQQGHGAQDVAFAQQMVVHHRGAVDMADTAVARATSAQVRDLAASISAAQGPEIEEMTSWLDAWGEAVPAGSAMGAHDAAGHEGAGTSNLEEVQELEGATGAEFDRTFLRMMIDHHEAGVEMAAAERAGGTDPRALELAGRIEQEQSAEVERMRELLGTLGG